MNLAQLMCVLCFQVFFPPSPIPAGRRTVPGRQPRRKPTANGWDPQRAERSLFHVSSPHPTLKAETSSAIRICCTRAVGSNTDSAAVLAVVITSALSRGFPWTIRRHAKTALEDYGTRNYVTEDTGCDGRLFEGDNDKHSQAEPTEQLCKICTGYCVSRVTQ